MDRASNEAGQAIALKMKPIRDAPNDVPNRLAVSPTALTAIPPAISSHGAFRLPGITVEPPMIRLSSSTSPIG